VGKWQFEDFYKLKNKDSSKHKEARIFWQHFSMNFRSNKDYNSEGLFPDSAKWDFNEKNNTIKLTNKDGVEEILNVIELDNKKLVITFKDSQGIIFKKLPSN